MLGGASGSWSIRAAISWEVDCESPQSAEAIVKIASPRRKIFSGRTTPTIPPVSRSEANSST